MCIRAPSFVDEEDQAGGGYTDADIVGRVPMACGGHTERDVAPAVVFSPTPGGAA